MPSSTVSLESLSSPSPSPPPQEEQQEQHSNHSGAAGLDSGSELSELTEDEQDNDSRTKDDDSSRSDARKKRQRDRIVPQPMWDWAVKKKPEKKEKSDWRTKLIEEEEEEEQAGPARAMEEEEDDDQDKDSNSDRDASPDRDRALSDNEVEEVEEEEPPEEDGESGDEAPSRDPHKLASGDVSGDENEDPEGADPDGPGMQQSPKAVASPDLTDDENEPIGEDEVDEDEDVQDAEPATKEGSEVEEEEEDDAVVDEVDVPDADELPTTEVVTPVEGVVDTVDADPDATMDIEAVQPILMSPVAVAASSIMAGASLMAPPSPSSSQPSTPSASRVSSRFPSAEPEQEQDVSYEHEVEPEPERKPSGRVARTRKGKGRTRAARRSRAAATMEPGEADFDADQAELPEGEGVDGDEMDVATPDLDLDSDMQPAHRAEALDVLATIELKFALLRERLYVEKMDSLAWEEGLIADGTHPELLHLHAELSSRRDKRLELAARRRDYEVANVTKRRRLDEAGAWSTWSNERDELQDEMIAETNGKKRRLERERRTLERPQPARRFPLPLHDVPPAPTLQEIVKSSPFGLPDSTPSLTKRALRKKEPSSQVPLAYPTLEPLSHGEIIQDLDLFYAHRHIPVGFELHRNMSGLMNTVLGGGMPQGMDPYAMGMPMIDGPNRFAPPMQQQHLQQQGMLQNFGHPPRLPHHHSAPPGALPHYPPAQIQMEQEMQVLGLRQPAVLSQHAHMPFGAGPGPGTLMRRSISPVSLNHSTGPSSIPNAIGGGAVLPGFAGSKANGWSGPSPSGKGPKRLNGESDGRDRERMGDGMSQRERAERERVHRDLEREREREAERAYHISHTPQRHGAHQHAHQHAHNNAPGQAAHHHNPHNHQHHHHHVLHHHHHVPHQGFPAPGSTAHGPPMAGLPPSSGAGPSVQLLSPHSAREFEPRRPRSGAPTEVIELSAPPQKQRPGSPMMSSFWKGSEGPLPPSESQQERSDRERAPGPSDPPQPDSHERLMTPFTMGPSQAPPKANSPRTPHKTLRTSSPAVSNPPTSVSTSRRGSWSAAMDDHAVGRPTSTPHGHPGPGVPPGGSVRSQRPSGSRLPQPPSASSFRSPFSSPPHTNGRPLPPPASPSSVAFPGAHRSPVRLSQPGRVPLGGPPSPPPPHPLSPRLVSSPGLKLGRVPSPGLPKASVPKMGGFPIPESGNIAPIATASGPPASGPLPAPATLLPPLPPPGMLSRMPNGPLSENVPPPTKIVPVDGL